MCARVCDALMHFGKKMKELKKLFCLQAKQNVNSIVDMPIIVVVSKKCSRSNTMKSEKYFKEDTLRKRTRELSNE